MRAKKKLSKQMLALLLSAVMIAEPASSAVTYAAEPVIGQTVDSVEDVSEEEQDTAETEEGKDETDVDETGETDGEEGDSEETGGDESGSDETGSDESGSDENDGDDQETDKDDEDTGLEEELPADETVEEEPEEGADVQDTVSANDLEEDKNNWKGTGHKAPKLEMQLTSAMVAEKRELKGTYERLLGLKKDVQYLANEAVFLADSKKYAETVAEGYGASLDSFEEGVAVMTFPDEVTDIIAMAEDEKVKLPAVYPNYYYTTCNDVVVYSDAVLIEDDNVAMAVVNDDPCLDSSAGKAYQYYHDEIKSTAAWNYNQTAGSGIKVAVIDSGVQKNHEDLKGRVSASVTYSTPYNKAEDNNGHGTHVSGIIAATANNGKGGAGIAYKASVVSIKALEQNPATEGAGGSTADIIKAVNASIKSGARVINMSLGGYVYDPLYEATIDTAVNKGIVVVAAAGNENTVLSKDKDSDKYCSPACFDNVITVSAKQKGSNAKADFSNSGSGIIDITAPGTEIVSSYPNGYASMGGTSQATPMVAAAAAYILSVSPDLKNNKTKSTVDTVKEILKVSATTGTGLDASWAGAGLLNVEAAIKMAAPTTEEKGGTGELTAPAVKKADGSDVANNATIQNTDKIALSATVGGASNDKIEIRYTTDGKAPTEKSTLYTAPFSIEASGNKTIKAVAIYYGKKSKVTSVKVKVNANMTSFAIASKTGSDCLGAGKSMNLVVDTKTVAPTYATNKKVTWKIIDYGNGATTGDNATINETSGQLKANANISAKTVIKVQATAKDGGNATAEKSITLLPKVESLTLTAPDNKKAYLLNYEKTAETVQMEVTVTPADANTGISYTSSNEKVAKVNSTGLVTAVGNGKATITAKTTDGSNKKVTLQVQVTKKVQEVKVTSKTGESQIAAGKTLPMVATVTSDATNKKVKWSVTGDVATINENNGQLKANKEVTAISTVTVKAEAQDGSGTYGEKTITVYPSITGKIAFEEGTAKDLGTTKIGELDTTVQLHPYTEADSENYFGRKENSGTTGLNNFTYTSSNTKIATVNETGFVTAVGKTGTAKIKVTAKDGSGKNASFTVKVVNPVTSISIYSKTGSVVVGRNKTLALGALVASLGGNASNKKLKWTSSDSSIATVDQNGKVKGVSFNADLATAVNITAEATDGSDVSRTVTVYVQPAITKLMFETKTGGYAATVKDTYWLSQVPDGKITTDNADDYLYYCLELYGFNTPYYFDESSGNTYRKTSSGGAYWDWDSVSCTCSNNNVIQIVTALTPLKQTDGSYKNVYLDYMIPVNKGNATITFKALDGSGKSAKFNITVK
ncbi:MAG: S8 family serine peptidase [Lachnospiraceae bacterium]|nr:S8 family serine peptidase [Lachnospiraceae bacterium]